MTKLAIPYQLPEMTSIPDANHLLKVQKKTTEAWIELEKYQEETKQLINNSGLSCVNKKLDYRPKRIYDEFFTGRFPKESFEKAACKTRKEQISKLLKPPYFIISIIVIFVCMDLWATKSVRLLLEYSPTRRRQLWRLLTYCTLHAGTQHLALNSLVALAVGWVIEKEQGALRIGALWVGGVVAGALGASIFQPTVHVIGASAGVYTLLTSYLASVCLGYGHIKLWWFRVLAVVVLSVSDCAWLILRSTSTTNPGCLLRTAQEPPPVAWAAHALGAAVGLPLALLVFTGVHSSKPQLIAARYVSAVLLVVGSAAAVFSNIYLHEDVES